MKVLRFVLIVQIGFLVGFVVFVLFLIIICCLLLEYLLVIKIYLVSQMFKFINHLFVVYLLNIKIDFKLLKFVFIENQSYFDLNSEM